MLPTVGVERRKMPPEKVDMQIVDLQERSPFQFLRSLLRRHGGWFANHVLRCPSRLRPDDFDFITSSPALSSCRQGGR